MANLAYSPELLPEWHSHTLPDDIFSKFDLEQDRALALSNPTVVSPLTSPAATLGIMTVSPCPSSPVQVGYGPAAAPSPLTAIPPSAAHQQALHGGLHQSHLLPTPPHSPPTEHDLDDLVASIPEILESQAASPPSDFNDILLDLEGMDVSSPQLLDVSCTSTLDQTAAPSWASPLQGASPASSTASWWSPLPSSSAEVVPEDPPVKKDCMWGGLCCPTALEPNHQHVKERTVSECSSTSVVHTALPNSLQADSAAADTAANAAVAVAAAAAASAASSCDEEEEEYMSEDEESTASETHHLPDTPSGTDSDCDSEDPKGAQSHHHHHLASNSSSSNSSGPRRTLCSASLNSFYSDHNYSERVPVNGTSPVTGIMTPSDTEDEVDVVSFNDSADTPSSTTASATTPTTETSTKRSADVKRQLQLAIQESMRNRQNRTSGAAVSNADESGILPVSSSSSTSASKLVSVKIRTQGKPAAYTKRMRDCHLENMKSTKHRRRNRGESDDCRRNTHNSLERQRRVELRNAFEHLRQLVPETKVLGKAPKVQILKKAALCCMQMQQAEERLLKESEKLKEHQEFLKQKIRMLTS